MIAFVALTGVEERQAQVITRRRERGVRLQRLPRHFDGAARVLQLPLRLAEQRQEFRIAGRLHERGFQLLARSDGPSQIEVEVRQKEPDLHEAGIQVQRLAELPDRFPLQLLGAPGAVGDAEEHVGVSRARIERQDLLQLLDVLVQAIGAGVEVGLDAVEPLLNRRWRGRLPRDERRAHQCAESLPT